jgi:hyperosmotically inducible periplasmic protein
MVNRNFKSIVPALFLALAMTLPACVEQDDTGSASQSMRAAGESANDAADSTGQVFVHAYNGAATAVTDSAITAKLKTTLFNDKLTTNGNIHVSTVAGTVTLEGAVPSSDAANRAEQLAQGIVGVRHVTNELTIMPNASTIN